MLKFLGHLAAPQASSTGYVQNGARLADGRAVVFANRDFEQMMLEIKPVAFDFVFRQNIRSSAEDAPPA
jgi:hypothetical protein